MTYKMMSVSIFLMTVYHIFFLGNIHSMYDIWMHKTILDALFLNAFENMMNKWIQIVYKSCNQFKFFWFEIVIR